MVRRIRCWVMLLALLLVTAPADARARNVIVLMCDGTGATHTTVARWYKGGPLAMDQMYVGRVRTWGAESLITDSAPAATAFATGHKASDKAIGVMPWSVAMPGVPAVTEETKARPVASVLEAAKLAGKATGIVVTSNVQHASPAAYSSHWPDRNDYNEIGEQQLYLGMDVIFGGGSRYLIPAEKGGARKDGEDLMEEARRLGYRVVSDRSGMMSLSSGRVLGLFAPDDLSYEFDRPVLTPSQPSLSEMTAKAIEILSKDPDGFFLFVEGSKIDWASHANDPVGVVSDVLAFDDAVLVALDFARRSGDTAVLVFSDHGNGGMSLGSKVTDASYSKLPLNALVEPLRRARLTGEGVERLLGDQRTESGIREVVASNYGITDLTDDEVKAIAQAEKGRMNYVLGPILSRRSPIGWTTNGHTGEDLFINYYGLKEPLKTIENTDIARICAREMGVNLDEATSRLFVDAFAVFGSMGASVRLDKSDPNNQVLVVERGRVRAEIPLSKSTMRLGGRVVSTGGLSVLSPITGKVYVPQRAVEVFKAAM
ncbi:Alkaline phosphatase [Thermanaerovibrio acidaminovorans DSM 6589]|uniref:Alkaline phosphatase n=1 Tax=Thermanaerovibrio acidaminovorans (strain ATCC 49978 / DSM 6589 / Su883) TaxID=525903 RepID=D1B834_THEAS|nr:alkaline phosphatase [Thermanaerovibrio acidaminovorans]ACZ18437.1 Alkaline phosphatase [Thermanaerovibrio acidaminovorans DSM 6589]